MNAAESIESAVASVLRAHTGRIVIGFSGGLDSTVLLHTAVGLVGDRDRVIALHINHRLSPHADSWERHCREVCARMGIRCVVQVVSVPTHGSPEEDARRVRYAAFANQLQAGDLLLLGHHQGDQAETVLWRLMRGAGSAALAGMPKRRALGRGELARPLLECPRAVLEQRAREGGFVWIDDDSNADLRFERNYVRHAVLPILRARWPDAASRLARAAHKFGAEAALLRRATERDLDDGGATRQTLPVGLLTNPATAQPLLRRWLERAGISDVRERVLAEIMRQLQAAPDRAPDIVVGAGLRVRRYRGALHLVRQVHTPFEPLIWTLADPLVLATGTLTAVRGNGPGLSASCAVVVVRPRRGGERLRLAGGRGSRSVKRLLQQACLPPWQRAAHPLVYVGESLAVVPGIAVDEGFIENGAMTWQIHWRPVDFDDIR